MKNILLSAAAVSLIIGAAPTFAKQDSQPILVDAGSLTQQWADDLSHDLDRQLRAVRVSPFDVLPNGLVQIRFEVHDGQAVNVRVHRPSGDRWLDRAAMKSVAHLDGIPAIPYEVDGQRTVQANIITARSDKAFDELSEELRDVEAARMASAGPDQMVIALNPGSNIGG